MSDHSEIHGELREINAKLGYISGTMRAVDDRLDNVEKVFTRVNGLENEVASGKGYVKGVSAAIALLFAAVGALSAFVVL